MAFKPATAEKVVHLPYRRAMRPIDLVHLTKQCLGDEGLEQEILRLFDTTVKTYFERLAGATTNADVAINLHSLKSAATGVGAWTIVELAQAAEAELQSGRPVTAERIEDLGMAVEEVGIFVARVLSDEPA